MRRRHMAKFNFKKFDKHFGMHFSDSIVIPLKEGGKSPIYKHKGLSVAEIRRYRDDNMPPTSHSTWGVLLGTDLVCIDFDDMLKHNEWVERFPDDFSTAPCETTKKGYHYYFQNDAMYTNKIGIDEKVDLLAVESTGTRHVCVCAPSPNKKWVRNIVDTTTLPMSAELKEYIAELRTPQDTDDTEELAI